MAVKVDGYDNRGSEEFAYGFVYFGDGRRVAYTSGAGVVPDASGGWDGVITSQHVKVAEEFLTKEGVL